MGGHGEGDHGVLIAAPLLGVHSNPAHQRHIVQGWNGRDPFSDTRWLHGQGIPTLLHAGLLTIGGMPGQRDQRVPGDSGRNSEDL